MAASGWPVLVTSLENDHETSSAANKHCFSILDAVLIAEASCETEVVGGTFPISTANNLNPGCEIIFVDAPVGADHVYVASVVIGPLAAVYMAKWESHFVSEG